MVLLRMFNIIFFQTWLGLDPTNADELLRTASFSCYIPYRITEVKNVQSL